MARYIIVLVLTSILLAGCGGDENSPTYSTSFENGLEDWSHQAYDWNPEFPFFWEIVPSGDISTDGAYSLKFVLNAENAIGAIFISRAFALEPDTLYRVKLSYDFASKDFIPLPDCPDCPHAAFLDTNPCLTSAAAPVLPVPPRPLGCFDDTSVGNYPVDDFVWLKKEFIFTARTGPDGILYAYVGVSAMGFSKTYYFDNLHISFQKVPFLSQKIYNVPLSGSLP
jgi:hypothetical protein